MAFRALVLLWVLALLPRAAASGLVLIRQEEKKGVALLEVRYQRDVPLFAEVLRPKGQGPFPTVLIAHGGFWGPTESLRTLARAWAEKGFLVALPHLRGQGRSGGRFTFCLEEGKDLRALAERLKTLGGRESWAYAGFSLGGCAALFVALNDPRVKVVAAVLAPMDFAEQYALLEKAGRKEALDRWRGYIGGSPAECPYCYALRSPLSWAQEIPGPVHLFQAGKDPLIPPRQACRFAEARQKAGRRVHQVALKEDGTPWQGGLRGGSACLRPTSPTGGPLDEDHLLLYPSRASPIGPPRPSSPGWRRSLRKVPW